MVRFFKRSLNYTCDGTFTYSSTFRYTFFLLLPKIQCVRLCLDSFIDKTSSLSSAQSKMSFKFMNENEIDEVAWKKRGKWENIFFDAIDLNRMGNWWAENGLCCFIRTASERANKKNGNWADVPTQSKIKPIEFVSVQFSLLMFFPRECHIQLSGI